MLDIRVPDAAEIHNGSELISALAEELPRYVAYIIGFLLRGHVLDRNPPIHRLAGRVDHLSVSSLGSST